MYAAIAATGILAAVGYATVTKSGVGLVHVAAVGAGPEDGFTNYKLFGNPLGTARPRWATTPLGSDVWIGSEYVGQSRDLAQYVEPTALSQAQQFLGLPGAQCPASAIDVKDRHLPSMAR